MNNRVIGVKKSQFIGNTSIPSGAYFDFVVNGQNLRIKDTDFYTALGVSGTIVQQGGINSVPVLDKQGAVNVIRNLYAGENISIDIRPDGSIEISSELQFTRFFDTVQDMEDATFLIPGQIAVTYGFNAVGDKGENSYLIGVSFGTADGVFIIDIPGSGLQAKRLNQVVLNADNVQEMNDAPFLYIGDLVTFSGYTTPGDGGGNKCEIGTGFGPADNGSVFDLSGSGLQARALFPGGIIRDKQFGVVGDGVADDSGRYQALANYAPQKARIKFLASTPLINSDVTFYFKGAGSGSNGQFSIDATGCSFSGAGKFIFDSCKYVNIASLEHANGTMSLRGVWFSEFTNCKFSTLHLIDAAGTDFTDVFWLDFRGGVFQRVVRGFGTSTAVSNAIRFYGSSFRGNTGQGFTSTKDYNLEFNGNGNSQNWAFYGCDLSYANIAIYNIDVGNTKDVEILFSSVYFDSQYPVATSRAQTRIVTENCHSANDFPDYATIDSVSRSNQCGWRADRSAHWTNKGGFNFIPNGDFRVSLPLYNGVGLPISNTGGATITPMSGAGLYNTYLNINQPGVGTVRFKSDDLPYNAKYTGSIIVRNADVGSKTLRMSFGGLFTNIEVSDTDWTLYTLTNEAGKTAGSFEEILLFTPDNSPYNVDVCYASITLGEGASPTLAGRSRREILHEEVHDVPSLNTLTQYFFSFPVAGVEVGDFVDVSHNQDYQEMMVSGYVQTAGTVTIIVFNGTSGTVNLSNARFFVNIRKKGFL